jgi:hypothetical protein
MDSAQPLSLSPEAPAAPTKPAQKQARASRFKAKLGRPSKRSIVGLKSYFNRCVRAGQLGEAARFHASHDLARYGIPAPAVQAALDHAAGPASPDHASSDHGGAGGSQRLGRENWDKTTPLVQNSQCNPLATATDVPLAVEADLTRLAAKAVYTPTVTPPAGESEGERGFGQAESRSAADNAGVTDKIVSVWPKVGEAIVGKLCRNKQYNELRVVGEDGREMWTKVGNWLFTSGLIRGERVLVRKIWGSGDDTDAEYEVVRRLDVNEPAEERRAESGSDSGSEFVAPVVAHESAVSEQQTPEASLDAQQTPVAILPQFQREEPDYPRKQESADDYIARIRAEAAMWANGQGR